MIDLDSLATEQTDVKALACNALSEVCRLSDHVMGALSAMRLMHIALDPGAAKVPIVKVEIRSTNVVVGPRSAPPNPVVCLSNWLPTSVRQQRKWHLITIYFCLVSRSGEIVRGGLCDLQL
jgi:hypothetical protein